MKIDAPRYDPFHRNFWIGCFRCNYVAGPAQLPGVVDTIVAHMEKEHPDVDYIQVKLSSRTVNGWPQEKLN